MAYTVKIEHFEGPLDLLLSLIEKEKVDVTTIALSEVTESYVQHVEEGKNINVANLAAFISVASQLLLLKSSALLPLLTLEDDEKEEIEGLELQLAALKVIKDIVPTFEKYREGANSFHTRESFFGLDAVFAPHADLSKDALLDGWRRVDAHAPDPIAFEKKIISDVVSVQKKMQDVQSIIRKRAEISFSELADEVQDVIVSFLAILELVKQGELLARQNTENDELLLFAETTKI